MLVLSDEPAAAGLPIARDAGVAAEAIDYRAYPGKEAFEAALDARLLAASAEIVCLAGFMRALSPPFVERWKGRMLNIHPSLLPNLRGLHTHRRALAQGLAEHGCTVHFVTAELDAGPIIAQARVRVLQGRRRRGAGGARSEGGAPDLSRGLEGGRPLARRRRSRSAQRMTAPVSEASSFQAVEFGNLARHARKRPGQDRPNPAKEKAVISLDSLRPNWAFSMALRLIPGDGRFSLSPPFAAQPPRVRRAADGLTIQPR